MPPRMRCSGCSITPTGTLTLSVTTCGSTWRSTWATRLRCWSWTRPGFLKKGTKSAGVARQYSGTAGRIENCQVGVFVAYATPAGRTFIDRELYLPKAWATDPARCAEAGIGPDVQFATKPELALVMLTRALDAGVPAGWVTADEVYGQHTGLRLALEERSMPYVLAVPVNQYTIDATLTQVRVDALSAGVPEQTWARLSAGDGAKGPRWYDWTRIPIRPLCQPGRYWLLVRRSLTDGDLAHYLCFCPPQATLDDLVTVAGRRWAIEESFQTAKGQVGLDHYQVRRYDAWYRHITLACLAHAYLSVTRAATNSGKKGGPELRGQLSELSVPEIRHLVTALIWHLHPHPDQVLHWSRWRRRHQARARRSHYTTRNAYVRL